MNPHEDLLAAIRLRQEKQTEFNRGILTADRYARTLMECVGSDLCYRYASKGNISFEDIIRKSASVLTYNNEEMVLEDVYGTKEYKQGDLGHQDVELPKNTLMVFKHVLTTPKKDRDGDILRTQGAKPDPKMLLLWQHVHTLPIGKFLSVAEHTSTKLSIISAIVDINELANDAAVMVDNKMGRFSHGFKALEFVSIKSKEDEGKPTSPGGFDIKVFEIMEESLVSVPSNTDAQTEEVLLSLVSGNKLKSPLLKGMGKAIKDRRPVTIQVPPAMGKIPVHIDLQLTLNGKGIGDDEELDDSELESVDVSKAAQPGGTKCQGKPGCSCGCGSSKKEDDHADDHTDDKAAEDKEMTCPDCGGKMVDGVCTKCGYGTKKLEKPEEEKVGRVLSNKNLTTLKNVRGDIEEIHEKELSLSRGGKALCKGCMKALDDVIASASQGMDVEVQSAAVEVTAKQAMAAFLAKATPEELDKMLASVNTIKSINARKKRTSRYKLFRMQK